MKKNLFLSAFFIIYTCSNVLSQQIDSVMFGYAENYPQEKVHIQFDKDLYRKGETIWFKAYILADMLPTAISKNFYVDWYDNNGKLLSHTSSPLYKSSSRGQFEIPSDYSGKMIRLKAYTKWMQNFDSSFIFDKEISVAQLINEDNKNKVNNERPATTIHFLPEGGNWLAGMESRVGFIVTNQQGKPAEGYGIVVNSKGEFIDSFTTTHDGMGIISLTPEAYNPLAAIWKDEYGNKNYTTLPLPQLQGYKIEAQPVNGKVIFVVECSDSISGKDRVAHIIAHINQHIVYKCNVNLVNKSAMGEIPTGDLPTGVLQITMFNSDWIPVAERVTFVNNKFQTFNTQLNIIEKSGDKRGKNSFEIAVDNPVKSNMSIAITDAGWYRDSTTSILTQLLLCSDVKGYIKNPTQYFVSTEDSIKEQLDLVMLTHGWRKFNWDAVVKGDFPKIPFGKDTDYLEIKGKVFGRAFTRRGPNQMINIILQAKDSSKQFIYLPINKNGEFVQKEALFFDTVKAYYQFNGEKRLTNIATVQFDNGLFNKYPKKINGIEDFNYKLPNFLQDTANLAGTKSLLEQINKVERYAKAHQLAEVTVRTRKKKTVDILDEKYTSGLFSGGDSYQFDLVNDPYAKSSPDIFWYLQGRVAGLQINEEGANVSLRWRGAHPQLYLDEMPARTEELRTLMVEEIAYVKVFRPPFFGFGGGYSSGEGGAIAIYTRKGSDVQFISGMGMGFGIIPGYTAYKEFYKPDYSYNQSQDPDVRTTLYWNPYILTDKTNNVFKVEFYNNDISRRLRVVLEGIDAEGKLTHFEKVIE